MSFSIASTTASRFLMPGPSLAWINIGFDLYLKRIVAIVDLMDRAGDLAVRSVTAKFISVSAQSSRKRNSLGEFREERGSSKEVSMTTWQGWLGVSLAQRTNSAIPLGKIYDWMSREPSPLSIRRRSGLVIVRVTRNAACSPAAVCPYVR